MKIKYVKFSDERRKEFCIKTVIGVDNDKPVVYKEAVFEEGNDHIKSIVNNAKILSRYFDVDICGVSYDDNKAVFDYIKGESLEKRYQKAMYKGDVKVIEELLKLHKSFVIGKSDNIVVMSQSKADNKIFGDLSAFVGEEAVVCCNYDAIASNIIFVADKPFFIDYEWVFEGPVPVDVVVYHSILEYYKHHPQMEEVYSFDDAMALLGINEDRLPILEKTYRSFYDYVIYDGKEEGFAVMKAICLKDTMNIRERLEKVEHENVVNMCECNRLQGVIDDINSQLIDKVLSFELLQKEHDRVSVEFEKAVNSLYTEIMERNYIIEGLQAKLFCFGSRKLLRRLKGVRRAWKK